MHGLTSGKLARAIRGSLNLGGMPPLGGEMQPVRRVIIDSRTARPGDVFFDVPAIRASGEGCWPEEAFARGAAGVVSSVRNLEPWAGAFAIHVDDPQLALLRLARRARSQWQGPVISIIAPEHGLAARCLAALTASRPSPLLRSRWELAVHCCRRPSLARAHTLQLDPATPWEISRLLPLCRPDILVINSPHKQSLSQPPRDGARQQPTPDAAPAFSSPTMLVVVDDDVRAHPDSFSLRQSFADQRPEQISRFAVTRREGLRLDLAWNDERVELAALPEWTAVDVALALVVGQQLGYATTTIVAACQSLLVHGSAKDGYTNNKEVPLSVSGLRESESALPPGLKRLA